MQHNENNADNYVATRKITQCDRLRYLDSVVTLYASYDELKEYLKNKKQSKTPSKYGF